MFLVGWVFCFRSKSLQFLAVKNVYINKWGTCPECVHKFFNRNRRKGLPQERYSPKELSLLKCECCLQPWCFINL